MPTETSIVIRTLNEAKHLEKLLQGIYRQNYKDWEIVLVDSGSTDGTVDLARRYGVRIFHIPSHEFTYGRSLNVGCREAAGRYLVFASGHVWPITNNWLQNMIKPFEDPFIAMVYGRQRGTDASRLSEQRDLTVQFGSESHILVKEPKGNNGNAAIRKDLWLKHPFDESLPGLEDVDWARRIERQGYRVYYAADAAVYHLHEETLKQVYQRHLREAVAVKQMFPRFRFTPTDLVKGPPYFMLRDFLYAFREGQRRKLFQVPGTRIAHFLGIYNGVRYQKRLAGRLAQRLGIPRTYHQVVVDQPGRHSLQEAEIPSLQPDEALIQVAYVGVCPQDADAANGLRGHELDRAAIYPSVPGHEYSGVVVRVGAKARHLRIGQKVLGQRTPESGGAAQDKGARLTCSSGGAYAGYVVAPSNNLYRLPQDVPLKLGTLIESVALCLEGMRRLDIAPGLSACVVGAGPMGNLCAQVLKARGLNVTAVDRNPRWLSFLYRYDIDTLSEVGPLGNFDYIIGCDGFSQVAARWIEESKPSAKVLLLGSPCAPGQRANSSGSFNREKVVEAGGTASNKSWSEAVRLVRRGMLDLDEHVADVAPLQNYHQVWGDSNAGERFKVLLNVSNDLYAL